MNDDRRRLGRAGEKLAAAYLRRKGYRILAVNYTTRFGELDLVARDRGEIVFVEVKTRRNDACGTPADGVSPRQTRHWQKAALAYLARNSAEDTPFRFEFVGIDLSGNKPQIELIGDISF